jgi:hypothetical protein
MDLRQFAEGIKTLIGAIEARFENPEYDLLRPDFTNEELVALLNKANDIISSEKTQLLPIDEMGL